MSAGSTISGTDGIIKIGGANEIPCLTAWTFAAKSDVQTIDTTCMKSNGDGGSSVGGGFAKKLPGLKSATLQATFNWQQDDAVGAASALRTTSIGSTVSFALYPNDSTSGRRIIAGNAIIGDISVPSEAKGIITQSVTLEVDEEWTDDVVS